MLLLRSLSVSRVVREHAMLDLAVDDRERLLDLEGVVSKCQADLKFSTQQLLYGSYV